MGSQWGPDRRWGQMDDQGQGTDWGEGQMGAVEGGRASWEKGCVEAKQGGYGVGLDGAGGADQMGEGGWKQYLPTCAGGNKTWKTHNQQTPSRHSVAWNNINESPKWNSSLLDIFFCLQYYIAHCNFGMYCESSRRVTSPGQENCKKYKNKRNKSTPKKLWKN